MENKKAIVKLLEIGCSIEEIKGVTGLSDEGLQKYSEILDKNRLSEEDFIEKRIKRLFQARKPPTFVALRKCKKG